MRENVREHCEKLYPVGSVVYLKQAKVRPDGTKVKVMIMGLTPAFKSDKKVGKTKLHDYWGTPFPESAQEVNQLLFNHWDIEKLVFEGYKDELFQKQIETFIQYTEAHWQEADYALFDDTEGGNDE
ncbi:MAG: DUF4176 domain-containing protein [Streptococcaceae bacterium]|jgi:hypothetical protein|nr:DUF4176 domain-containing protein [Streptococcaceae bacterium]